MGNTFSRVMEIILAITLDAILFFKRETLVLIDKARCYNAERNRRREERRWQKQQQQRELQEQRYQQRSTNNARQSSDSLSVCYYSDTPIISVNDASSVQSDRPIQGELQAVTSCVDSEVDSGSSLSALSDIIDCITQ